MKPVEEGMGNIGATLSVVVACVIAMAALVLSVALTMKKKCLHRMRLTNYCPVCYRWIGK